MKKLFVLAGAVLAALAINANVQIDLSSAPSNEDATISHSYASNVLTIDYDFSAAAAGSYPAGTLEFSLNDLTGVTKVAVSVKGSDVGKVDPLDPESSDNYAGVHVYLLDEDGKRWVDSIADIQISGWKADKFYVYELVPNEGLWGDAISGELGTKTFKAIGFMANTEDGIKGSYQIDNAVIYTSGTSGLKNHRMAAPASKMMRNGRFMIRRGNEMFSAMGQLMK